MVTGWTPVSDVPHSPQNFTPGAFEVPHCGQAVASRAPHSPQNLRPASLVVPHAGQVIKGSPRATVRSLPSGDQE
jgi:hypothetical protein